MTISKERLAEIEGIKDEDIDFSDTPELDDTFFKNAKLVMPKGVTKKTVTMRMDDDVLDWFKSHGKGHLTRMNAVLRAYMLAHQSGPEG